MIAKKSQERECTYTCMASLSSGIASHPFYGPMSGHASCVSQKEGDRRPEQMELDMVGDSPGRDGPTSVCMATRESQGRTATATRATSSVAWR